MAVYGLGSHDEPIIVSDDEDATYVENELNRWNNSSSSSSSSSPVTRDHPHTLHGIAAQPASAFSAPTASIATAKQKRKRLETETATSGVLSQPLTDIPERRTKKKKQKTRQDTAQSASQTQNSSPQYERYDHPVHNWPSAWPTFDSTYPPAPPAMTGYPPMQHAMHMDPYPPAQPSTSWTSDAGGGRSRSSHAPYPPASHHQEAGSSWRSLEMDYVYPPPPPSAHLIARVQPAHPAASTSRSSHIPALSSSSRLPTHAAQPSPIRTALDDSLRRLQELSASLLGEPRAMPTVAPPFAPPQTPATALPAAPPTDTDKRRIGKYDDKTNAASFDLHSSTLHPTPTATLPPPSPTRALVVAHLPKKFRHLDFVTTWAERFGKVARLELDSKSGKALVEYKKALHAEAAFASFKLRGDGKEHIRVYWYKRPTSSLPTSTTRSANAEVEEGELEEGEVVEGGSTYAPPKAKKKKGKKKAQTLEQRFIDPVPPPHKAQSQASIPRPDRTSTRPAHLPPSPTRPSLEERFTDAPAVTDGIWEEEIEMELDSEDDYRQQPPSAASPQLLATHLSTPPGEAELEDWEADMDVEASSPMREVTPPLPLPLQVPVSPARLAPPAPRPRYLKRPRALSFDEERPRPAACDPEARRKELEAVFAPLSASLSTPSSGSAPSTISSGTSTTPEPVTPREVVVDTAVALDASAEAIASDTTMDAIPPLSETGAPTVSLDDLAVTFITESIQAAAALPKPPSPSVPRPPKASLPPKPLTLPKPPPPAQQPSHPTPHSLPLPLPSIPVAPSPSVSSTPQLSEKAQLLAKKQRLEDHIAASKELLARIMAAKSKPEKDRLMRLLKERQRAMDSDLQGGRASPSTPGARVAPATPTPAPKATLFRWPQTARELIIDISDSDDEVL